MARTVVGLFDVRAEAEAALRELREAGFNEGQINYLASNARHDHGVADTATSEATEIERGAGFGATSGALMGGAVGLLVGLGALVIPGIGPALAAGSWASALAGTAVGAGMGAAAGGLIGALVGAGVPEAEAEVYAESVRRGSVLLAVEVESAAEAERATAILRRHNVVDINRRGRELREDGWTGFEPTAEAYTGSWYGRPPQAAGRDEGDAIRRHDLQNEL